MDIKGVVCKQKPSSTHPQPLQRLQNWLPPGHMFGSSKLHCVDLGDRPTVRRQYASSPGGRLCEVGTSISSWWTVQLADGTAAQAWRDR